MPVIECDVPLNSALGQDLVQSAWFHDSYRVKLARPGLSIVDIFFALFGHTPFWMKALLITRNAVARCFGLEAPTAAEILHPTMRASYHVGDKIGPWPIYFILIPIEVMGMFVRPFALTMRLAANMTGGHIAILAILSFVFLFTELFGRAIAGVGVGLAVSIPLAVGISGLEILVVLIQAYVFTLLTAVFIGMAIHVHH